MFRKTLRNAISSEIRYEMRERESDIIPFHRRIRPRVQRLSKRVENTAQHAHEADERYQIRLD
jgi:hypothetical protein